MSQAKLVKILVGILVVIGVAAALAYGTRQELQVTKDLSRTRETALALVEVHRQASQGTIKMLGPDSLDLALQSAGFPPKRPMPSLKPRAELKGGALADAADQTVSFAHYVAKEGRFTVFLVPTKKDILPSDAALVIRRGREMQLVKRDEVTLVFWQSGFWYTVVVTEMPAGDRDLFVDFVRQAQGT
jgi:hypothetical protein